MCNSLLCNWVDNPPSLPLYAKPLMSFLRSRLLSSCLLCSGVLPAVSRMMLADFQSSYSLVVTLSHEGSTRFGMSHCLFSTRFLCSTLTEQITSISI